MDARAVIDAVKWDALGLVAVVAQDRASGVVRMLAWASREALEQTAATGAAHFRSRSRKSIWRKGEESGNQLAVSEMRIDCDGDTVLYLCDAKGPTCHTGKTSCFHRSPGPGGGGLVEDDGPAGPPAAIVARVADVIAQRRRDRPDRSYVVSLLDGGFPKIAEKITEEAAEICVALPEGDPGHTAHEAADVIFHLLVGLEAADVPIDDVFAELGRRFGTSGLDEKQSRKK